MKIVNVSLSFERFCNESSDFEKNIVFAEANTINNKKQMLKTADFNKLLHILNTELNSVSYVIHESTLPKFRDESLYLINKEFASDDKHISSIFNSKFNSKKYRTFSIAINHDDHVAASAIIAEHYFDRKIIWEVLWLVSIKKGFGTKLFAEIVSLSKKRGVNNILVQSCRSSILFWIRFEFKKVITSNEMNISILKQNFITVSRITNNLYGTNKTYRWPIDNTVHFWF